MFSNPPLKHTLKGALDPPQPRIPVRAVRSDLILSHSTPRDPKTSEWENHQPQSLGRHVPTFLQACNVCSVTYECRRLWTSAFSPDNNTRPHSTPHSGQICIPLLQFFWTPKAVLSISEIHSWFLFYVGSANWFSVPNMDVGVCFEICWTSTDCLIQSFIGK